MHEYEFRLVVQHSSSMVPVLQYILREWSDKNRSGDAGCPRRGDSFPRQHVVHVVYAKPHFRYRGGSWEVKRKVSALAVYHDTVWFRWVHSLEIPFERWTRSTCASFVHAVGNYQDPLIHETRVYVRLDSNACLYAFDNRLVFEWECGAYREKLSSSMSARRLLDALSAYRDIYTVMYRNYSPPPLRAPSPVNGNVTAARKKIRRRLVRKTVTCVDDVRSLEGGSGGKRYLMAHKIDGTFGYVETHAEHVNEIWEGHERRIRPGTTFSCRESGGIILNGFVFAAEKCEISDAVVVLDVYAVRGCSVAGWSRRAVLTEFLPSLRLPDGYGVQVYRNEIEELPPFLGEDGGAPLPTDGYIAHDVVSDLVYKIKDEHTIDAVYRGGWFWLANRTRIACPTFRSAALFDGRVYELSMEGKIVRERKDRFTGNTVRQLQKIFECSPWKGTVPEKVVPAAPMTPKKSSGEKHVKRTTVRAHRKICQ